MKASDFNVVDGGDPVRRQAAAWFARLRADDVSEQEQRHWQDWLESDSRHRAAYERVERLWSGFGSHAPHPEIALRLHGIASNNEMSSSIAPTRHGRARRRRWWIAATAATAFVAIATGWLVRPHAAPEKRFATAVGEHRSIVLEDGSRVTLDTDTLLRVSFTKKERLLTLDRGRAFFQVAKESRPLSVHTDKGSVRAVGTTFEVYRHQQEIEVTLLEGQVLLLPPKGSERMAPIPMAAGHKARVGKRSAPTIETVAAAAMPAWLAGRLMFDDEPLASVLVEFNRYNQKRIVLGDDELEQVRISGVFRNDDPHAFLDALRESYAVSTSLAPSGDLVLIKRAAQSHR